MESRKILKVLIISASAMIVGLLFVHASPGLTLYSAPGISALLVAIAYEIEISNSKKRSP